jgi:hypothetical protein
MTIPHQQDEVSDPSVTYDQASQRYGPGTHAARGRHDELSVREHLSRAYARLKASGRYDAAKHGTRATEPLTAAEHLELLATAEYLARVQAAWRGRPRAAGCGNLAAGGRGPGHRRGHGPGAVPGLG